MYLDHEHWGQDDSDFVVSFGKDRYAGPPLNGDLKPFFLEEHWCTETRFIQIYCGRVIDTLNFEDAAIFADRHEAARAVQWHRKERGDRGQVYDICPL